MVFVQKIRALRCMGNYTNSRSVAITEKYMEMVVVMAMLVQLRAIYHVEVRRNIYKS